MEIDDEIDKDLYTPEELALLVSIAKSEGLHAAPSSTPLKAINYTPIYKHPLPITSERFVHEDNLRKILSARISLQGMAAIAKGDAWALEEVYMRHGHACLQKMNGTPPIHLAVQMNNLDCVMVLVNIGVDLNEPNEMNFTPLYVAQINKFKEIEKFLLQQKAVLIPTKSTTIPVSTVLEVYPERLYEVEKQPDDKLEPSPHKRFYKVTGAKNYF